MLFPAVTFTICAATGQRENSLPTHNPISVAVVGVGVFGRNHARVYKELELQGEPVRLLGVVDPDVNRADAVAREFECKAFGSVQQMLTTHSELQAASIAAPTVQHMHLARELMRAGVDVLIEKPLATTLAEADELVKLAAQHKRIAQVGHLERFNPAVRATIPLLTQPMFFEVHRLSVFTPRSLDVDVVLDLMIHDIDIVLTFAKSAVKEVRAVGLPILSGKVDIANVRLELESGCIANFTASRVSTERVRKVRFFQPRQYVSLDYGRQEVLVFTVGSDGASASSAFGQSADRGEQASSSLGRAAACGAEVVHPCGAGPVHAGGPAGRRSACARPGATDRCVDPRAWEEGRTSGIGTRLRLFCGTICKDQFSICEQSEPLLPEFVRDLGSGIRGQSARQETNASSSVYICLQTEVVGRLFAAQSQERCENRENQSRKHARRLHFFHESPDATP